MPQQTQLRPSDFAGGQGATPVAPREPNLRERVEKLEAYIQNVDKAHSEQLNVLAEKIIQLQNQVL